MASICEMMLSRARAETCVVGIGDIDVVVVGDAELMPHEESDCRAGSGIDAEIYGVGDGLLDRGVDGGDGAQSLRSQCAAIVERIGEHGSGRDCNRNFDLLEGLNIFECGLRFRCCGKQCGLVTAKHLEPRCNIGDAVVVDVFGEPELASDEMGVHFGNKLFGGIDVIAE